MSLTIKPNYDDHPMKINYASPSSMFGLSPSSPDEVIEMLKKIQEEFGVIWFRIGDKQLVIRGGRENYSFGSEPKFRMQVIFTDDALRSRFTLQSPIEDDYDYIVDIIVSNTFRGYTVKRFLMHTTVTLERAIDTARFFMKHQDISNLKEWIREDFTPQEWFRLRSDLHYDSPNGSFDIESPSIERLILQVSEIDGLNNRSLHLSTQQGRLMVNAIVEIFDEDINSPSFYTNRLRLEFGRSSDRWILVDPNLYTDDYDEEEVSFILGNGQGDPAAPHEAVEREIVKQVVQYFWDHTRMPDNYIWVRRNYQLDVKDTTSIHMRYNQDGDHKYINAPTTEQIIQCISKLDASKHHRMSVRAHNRHVFIHATSNHERVVLSYFEADNNNHLRRDRLVEYTNSLDSTPLTIFYSPSKGDTVPFYETIPKQQAISAIINFVNNAVFILNPNDTWMADEWWSVKWRC